MQKVAPNSFMLADIYLNSPLPCSSVPRLHLGRWESVLRSQGSSSEAEAAQEAEILEAIR
jgi:hypothetical protein